MLRALELATLGRGYVSPNPMVGCLIVHEDRIIGEGWHPQYGKAHAEVNAIHSVRPEDTHLLPEATVYVTLEPCSHWGKTPPCSDLLIQNRIKRVICCNNDPNPLVAGQGFQKLRDAGIAVETGLMAEQGRKLNARFFTFMEKKRPYIILKWAETSDGFVSDAGGQPVQISGPLARRLVHRWRSEEDAIMVGTNTARLDNPRLNVRLWPHVDSPGRSAGAVDSPGVDSPVANGVSANPTRIVIDKQLSLRPTLNLFDNSQPTLIYNCLKMETAGQNTFIQVNADKPFLPQLLTDLYERRIQSVLVEGGTTLLNSFLDAGLWDEMRVLRSPMLLNTTRAMKAPTVRGRLATRTMLGDDEWSTYQP